MLFYLVVMLLIWIDPTAHRPSHDQNGFHLPTVELFAQQLPMPDFSDYPSATTPGYHLALALVRRGVEDVRLLRLAGSLFTAGLLATLALALSRRTAPATALVLCLPMVASVYVLPSGVWLLPDNAGWWGVLGVMLVALRPRVGLSTYVLGGTILIALVFVRQIHLWAAAVLWIAAWLGTPHAPEPASNRIRRLGAMAAATLPASLLVAGFYLLWGGPTPPSFAQQHAGANPAVPATILAVFGILAVFYLPFVLPRAGNQQMTTGNRRQALSVLRTPVLAGVVLGLIVGIVPETSYDYAAGRFSGIWNLVPYLPTFADRSPLMVLLSALGGGLLALWWAALPRRDGAIFLGAWIAFILAHSANAQAWQRYYEPFALLMLAVSTARLAERHVALLPRWALAGPLALAGLLALVTLMAVLR